MAAGLMGYREVRKSKIKVCRGVRIQFSLLSLTLHELSHGKQDPGCLLWRLKMKSHTYSQACALSG